MIENELRNKGRDGDADDVHVWMRRRDRRNTRGLWPVIGDRFLDLTTEYGTTSKPLFWIMLVWLIATVLVFRDPARVSWDIAPARDQPPAVQHPLPADWGTADAAFMAVRLHVPIVSLGVDEPVEPSDDWVKAYAMIVIAASWLMWPLFIASVSGYLRRRT